MQCQENKADGERQAADISPGLSKGELTDIISKLNRSTTISKSFYP